MYNKKLVFQHFISALFIIKEKVIRFVSVCPKHKSNICLIYYFFSNTLYKRYSFVFYFSFNSSLQPVYIKNIHRAKLFNSVCLPNGSMLSFRSLQFNPFYQNISHVTLSYDHDTVKKRFQWILSTLNVCFAVNATTTGSM